MRTDVKLLDESILRQQCEDSLFRLALVRLEKKQADQLQAEADAGGEGFSAEEMEAAYINSLPRVQRSIQAELRKQHAKAFYRNTLPRVYRIVAGVLLFIFIGMTSALALSRTVRVYLMNFLINTEEQYTELGLVTDPNVYVDVPDGWGGEYFPSYIPDSYIVVRVDSGYISNIVRYVNAAGEEICFEEMTSTAGTNIDTEDAIVQLSHLNGETLLTMEKSGHIILAWAYTDRYFVLNYDGAMADAMKIVESIVRIK